MDKKLSHFLEFKGKRLSVLSTDGQWWVAIKPICEALDVDYIEQFKGLKSDDIFGQLLCEHTTVAADGKARKMTCLPERYIYGWLLGIRSNSSALRDYKLKCYDILYNHFHGTLTGRITTLGERSEIDLRILELEEKLKESD